jgi:glycosyltransferase involved in cell wall biosynthesis
MSTSLPRISVLTAVRNGAHSLERAIESMLSQAYPNLEYIVLDAASTDGTLDILKKYEAHVSQWRSHKDDGPNAAYNEGIRKASGEIIALLNADDWFEPGILMAVGEAFAKDPELEIITCVPRIVKMDTQGNVTPEFSFNKARLPVSLRAYPVPNARFYRKSMLDRVGLLLEKDDEGNMLIVSDVELMLRLSLDGPKHLFLDQLGYTYLAHDRSITYGNNAANKKRMYYQRAFIARVHLPKCASYPAAARALLKRWHRRATNRIFLWQWSEGNRPQAWKTLKEGVRVGGPLWLADLLRVAILRKHQL